LWPVSEKLAEVVLQRRSGQQVDFPGHVDNRDCGAGLVHEHGEALGALDVAKPAV
jgi:hypothetical protein